MSKLNRQRQKAHQVFKTLRKGLLQSVAVLDADVRFAADQWRLAPTNQFWSRTLLRCCCASVEGTLSLLKQATPKVAEVFCVNLTADELKVVLEIKTVVEKTGAQLIKPVFLPFRDNIKETLKIFLKAHTVSKAIRFDVAGYADLCGAFELRNKLMHPKNVFDLQVDDKALTAADRGLKWYKSTLVEVLEACDPNALLKAS